MFFEITLDDLSEKHVFIEWVLKYLTDANFHWKSIFDLFCIKVNENKQTFWIWKHTHLHEKLKKIFKNLRILYIGLVFQYYFEEKTLSSKKAVNGEHYGIFINFYWSIQMFLTKALAWEVFIGR